MKKLILFIVSVFMIASCKEQQDQMSRFLVFDFPKKDVTQSIPIDSIVEKTSMIQLDTSSSAPIIGGITLLYESENAYFVVSDGVVVYEYDKAGKFVRQIGATGRGPGEYLSVGGIYSNKKDSSVIVFDFPGQTVLKYDNQGRFINSCKPQLSDSLLYLTSFFPNQDTLIFYASNNSSGMDLLQYNEMDGTMSAISTKDRSMLPEEAIMCKIFSFGDRVNPFIYNYFNDTVYVLKNKKLTPSFLMQLGDYRFGYEELTIDKLMALQKSKINLQWIVCGGNYLFISYSISQMEGKKGKQFLALYNTQTKEYMQNIEITNVANEYSAIVPGKKLFQGFLPNELLSVKNVSDTDNRSILIKYKMK
ncbi:MAG: 6-bladed beta-propeller [Bacteroidales bacterium]